MSLFRTLKDQAAAYVARDYINKKIRDYGVLTKLDIDSKLKNIHLAFQLKGETQPILVDAFGYELISQDGKTSLKVSDVKISRDWLNSAFEQFLKGKTLDNLPEVIRVLL